MLSHWEKPEKMPAWQVTKVKSKIEVIQKAAKRWSAFSLCYIDGLLPPKELEVGAAVSNIMVVWCSEVML